ncbi:MAG: leucyl aminopeptidase [Candidatus Promineifilaceae bacterium]|nr:leucyl aminopeptidase [Candidatus Promineifilaceae bacterium]
MDVTVTQGSIQSSDADTIVVNLFQGVTEPGGATGAVDGALDGAIGELIAGGDFQGKEGEVAVLYPRGAIPARRVLVTGLGERESFGREQVRRAAAAAIKRARDLKAEKVATVVHGAGIGGEDTASAAQATAEGSLLALYRYNAARQEEEEKHEVQSLTIVEFDEGKLTEIEHGVRAAEAVAAGVKLARDLVNEPPNVATPTRMAEAAAEIAEAYGLAITVGGREWAAEHEMGAFLAVAQGAGEPPKFIVLEHDGGQEDASSIAGTIVIVGKGITFDTGGISIKPSKDMGRMKADMGGAAAVLGAMKSVALLDLPLRVIGIAPCTENMPDANAYRPADVIRASNGKTIEIISTDAEGRMVLADGLVYAGRYQPDAVIDLATLTGASVVALGENVAAGLFSTETWLRDRLSAAGETTHERVWPLPLWDDYREKIKSDVADIKNSGGRFGGVGTSASFLHTFTDYPWAHLDIAGVVASDKGSAYAPAGATGFGVRLLVEFLRNWKGQEE